MWYSYRELIYRVGTFFLMIGFFLVVLFMVSESAGQVMFSYFCWGISLIVIGFMARAQYKRSIESSERFSTVRKLFSKKSKDDKGKK